MTNFASMYLGFPRHPLANARRGLADSLFVLAIVAVSVGPYLTRLGFYSDDWNFLGEFVTSQDQSFWGLLAAQSTNVGLLIRPTQMLYQAALYSSFGVAPFGYHLVNAGVLGAMGVIAYWALREWGLVRHVALAVSAVYLMLPNYSASRFWFANFACALSLSFCLLSIYADLRTLRASGSQTFGWQVTSLLSSLLAGLGYEVTFPLLLVGPFALWKHNRKLLSTGHAQDVKLPWYVFAHLVLLLALAAYKFGLSLLGLHLLPVHRWSDAATLLLSATLPNLGTYGLALPQAVAWAASNASSSVVLSGLLIGGLTAVYLAATSDRVESRALTEMSNGGWMRLACVGLLIVVAGYAVFLFAGGRYTVTSSGYGNRISTVASLGLAMIWTAGIGWLADRLFPHLSRTLSFGFLCGILCCAGYLIIGTLSQDQAAAWSRQQVILREIRSALPQLGHDRALILTGTCPYIGSAIVFESSDLEGALWVIYSDRSLKADVGSRLSVEPSGLTITSYGDATIYPYSSRLILFDEPRALATTMPDMTTAENYLGTRVVKWPRGCPEGTPDAGHPIFPADKFYAKWGSTTSP